MDGRTDTTKLMVAFHNFVYAPNKDTRAETVEMRSLRGIAGYKMVD